MWLGSQWHVTQSNESGHIKPKTCLDLREDCVSLERSPWFASYTKLRDEHDAKNPEAELLKPNSLGGRSFCVRCFWTDWSEISETIIIGFSIQIGKKLTWFLSTDAHLYWEPYCNFVWFPPKHRTQNDLPSRQLGFRSWASGFVMSSSSTNFLSGFQSFWELWRDSSFSGDDVCFGMDMSGIIKKCNMPCWTQSYSYVFFW